MAIIRERRQIRDGIIRAEPDEPTEMPIAVGLLDELPRTRDGITHLEEERAEE